MPWRVSRRLLLCVLAVSGLWAQTRFPVAELPELTALGTEWRDSDTADLRVGTVYAGKYGEMRLEGADDDGNPWFVRFNGTVGLGRTRAFVGDLDANGRDDLVLSMLTIGNGRCIDHGEVIALLFDNRGRPVPWRAETHGLWRGPLLFDADGDGRAEFVVNDCSYSAWEPPKPDRHGEDRWISGVFEANAQRWETLPTSENSGYLAAVQAIFDPYDGLVWPTEAGSPAVDPHAGWGKPTRAYADGLEGPVRICEDAAADENPLCVSARNRALRLASGEVLTSKQDVVLDRVDGREIYLADQDAAILELLLERYPLRVLGDGKRKILWAEATKRGLAGELTRRLALRNIKRHAVELAAEGESASTETKDENDAPGVVFDAGGFSQPRTTASDGTPTWTARLRVGDFSNLLARARPTLVLSRGDRCYTGDLSDYRRSLEPIADCSPLGDMKGFVTADVGVVADGPFVRYKVVDAVSRSVRFVKRGPAASGSDGAVEELERPVRLAPPDGPNDILLGAVYSSAGFIAQWARGGRSWLTVHDPAGKPVSKPLDLAFHGELLRGGDEQLEFLVWAGNAPKEHVTASLRISFSWVE